MRFFFRIFVQIDHPVTTKKAGGWKILSSKKWQRIKTVFCWFFLQRLAWIRHTDPFSYSKNLTFFDAAYAVLISVLKPLVCPSVTASASIHTFSLDFSLLPKWNGQIFSRIEERHFKKTYVSENKPGYDPVNFWTQSFLLRETTSSIDPFLLLKLLLGVTEKFAWCWKKRNFVSYNLGPFGFWRAPLESFFFSAFGFVGGSPPFLLPTWAHPHFCFPPGSRKFFFPAFGFFGGPPPFLLPTWAPSRKFFSPAFGFFGGPPPFLLPTSIFVGKKTKQKEPNFEEVAKLFFFRDDKNWKGSATSLEIALIKKNYPRYKSALRYGIDFISLVVRSLRWSFLTTNVCIWAQNQRFEKRISLSRLS